jgi:ribose transport system permease protein/putative xylitol transport system permease protein
VLSGAICGFSGVMLTGQVGAGTPTAGSGLLLNSIAAVVMGGTALSGGIGGPHRTLLGVLVIAILTNGMDVTEVNSFTQDIVKGAVIILAVSLTIDRSKYSFIK